MIKIVNESTETETIEQEDVTPGQDTFRVYAEEKEDLEKKLSKLQRKSETYGIFFHYEFGSPYPFEITVYDPSLPTGRQVIEKRKVEAIDVTFTTDSIRKGKYSVLAHIDHKEGGNVITAFGDVEVDKSWYDLPSKCEHCNANRKRNKTYIVLNNETGETKQIGSSCLDEYTGIMPRLIIFPYVLFSDLAIDGRVSVDSDEFGRLGKAPTVYPVEFILGLAYDCIKKYGYIRSDEPGSTRQDVLNSLNKTDELKPETKQAVDEIIKYVLGYTGNDSMVLNAQSIIKGQYCNTKYVGRLAYVPLMVERMKSKDDLNTKKEAEKKEEVKSEYVGSEGQKIKFTVKSGGYVTSWDGAYGRTHLYKFIDEKGNVITWMTGRGIADGKNDFTGDTLEATVKSHEDYKGVKQTIVTRVKLSSL